MSRTISRLRATAPLIATLMLSTALGGCNGKVAPDPAPSGSASGDVIADAVPTTVPLSTTGPAALAAAPPVAELPAGRPIALRRLADRRQGYRWLDRAYYQESAVEDAPPDYSFDHGGVRPWTWSSGDGARVISEPVAGGYRTYYYEAGSQEPYLVRDPRYSYAYDNGALIGVYTLNGALADPERGSAQASYGARYYDRGANLYRGARSAPHLPVNAYAWGDRRADLSAGRVAWHAHAADNPDWSAWSQEHADEERSRWDAVRQQHEAAAQQFGSWQQQDYQGPPPQLYNGQDRPQNGRRDHTAAVIGGVVAAGVAATAAHAILAHPGAPQQGNGAPPPARAPASPYPGNAPMQGRAAPGSGAPRHAAPVARPAPVTTVPTAPMPVHAVPPRAVQPVVAPPRPAAAPPHAAPAAALPARMQPPLPPQRVPPSRPAPPAPRPVAAPMPRPIAPPVPRPIAAPAPRPVAPPVPRPIAPPVPRPMAAAPPRAMAPAVAAPTSHPATTPAPRPAPSPQPHATPRPVDPKADHPPREHPHGRDGERHQD